MLEVFGAAFQSVVTLFLFVAAGFLIRKFGMVKSDFAGQLSTVLFNFFMPCMLLDIILTSVDFGQIAQNGLLMLVSIIVMAAGIGIGYLVWLPLRKPFGTASAIPAFSLGFPNFAFMGIPVTAAIYGSEATGSLLFYILPLYFLVNIVGYMVMSSQKKLNLKKVFNPCTLAILAGFLLKLLPAEMPAFFLQTIDFGSNVVSPMAMFSAGLVMGGCKFGKLRENADLIIISAFRLLVLPLGLLGILWVVGLRGFALTIPVMATAMPVAANMTVLAGASGRHEEVSARMVFLSTLLSLVTIPVVAALIPAI